MSLSCNTSKVSKKETSSDFCSDYSLDRISKCELLKIFSDSSKWIKYIKSEDCLYRAIYRLKRDAAFPPSWFCDYGGCRYFSYSLEKSLFKVDLLRWMRFYGCADTVTLKSRLNGGFNAYEIEYIKRRAQDGNPVDTSILYQ